MMLTLFKSSPLLFLPLLLVLLLPDSLAWTLPSSLASFRKVTRPIGTRPTSSRLFAVLPEGYREYGNQLIYQAASLCGATKEQIDIAWKGGRIVVTVHGNVYVSNPLDESDSLVDNDGPSTGVDVTALARAINAALDDNGTGLAIAEAHEIVVTTPGASDELSGIMFESYKGFDVIVEHQDPKKNTIKRIEGRLVERNDEFTIINIKGRMKKLKNQDVISVKLPKAKKEKR